MKRAPFIGGSAAVFLAGCGGSKVMRAIPGVATTAAGQAKPPSGAVRLVPQTADSIPSNVLASPTIGEFRRFDGKTAPANWMFAQGQTMTVTENPHLFSLLGRLTGDGKASFLLPNPPFSGIIAIAGSFASSPVVLAAVTRSSLTASLGPGAVPRPPRQPKITAKAAEDLAAQRKLTASAVRGLRAAPALTSERAAQFRQAATDARASALAVLTAPSRARLDAALDAASTGRTSVYAAVSTMASALTSDEAVAVLRVGDAMGAPFGAPSSAAHSTDPRNDAAHFLVAVGFSPPQLSALLELERSRA